jgi:mannosyltransferase
MTKRDRLREADHRLLFGGVLVLLLLLSFYLRVARLAEKSLWQDEIFTAAIAATENSVLQVATIPLHNTALPAPPLYFLITHAFLHLGDRDFLLRFPALTFGVLGVAATYLIGARLFNRETGLLGAFLLSVSSLHVRYSQDARFYSLMVLLSLLTLYCLWRALFDEKRLWWAGFVVCTVLNMYNHLFGLLVLLAEAVFVGGLWIKRDLVGCWSGSGEGRHLIRFREAARTLVSGGFLWFLVSLSIVLAFYAPMIPHLLRGITSRKGLGGEMTPGVSAIPTFLGQVLEAWGNGPGLVFALFFVPFMIGLAACVHAHPRQLWLACSWVFLPLATLLLVPAQHGFRPRYILFILPVYLIFVAVGLIAGSQRLGKRVRGLALAGPALLLALSVLVLALVSIPALRSYYNEPRSDWKAVAKLLERGLSGSEIIVSPGPFAQFALTRYGRGLSGTTFLIGGSEVFLSSEEAAQGGVWFVGPGREAMTSTEAALRAATPTLFKVVFEVDADRAEQGIRLNVAPTMYSDLWVLYVREGLAAEELIKRYQEALEVVPESVAESIHAALEDLYRQQQTPDEAMMHYQDAIRMSPSGAGAHSGLAQGYGELGIDEEAAAEWELYRRLVAE